MNLFLFVVLCLHFSISNAQFASRLFLQQQYVGRTAITKKDSDTSIPFQDFNGTLNFTSDFKGLSIVPNINIWGSQQITNQKGQISVHAFVSINKYDSLLYNSSLKLFLPEASQYGFSFKGIHQLTKKSAMAEATNGLYLNWQANILGKSFVYTNSGSKEKSDEGTMVIHPKLGIDWVVAKGFVDFYGNLNGIVRLTNVEKFDSSFNNKKDLNLFFDVGLGFMLNLEKNEEPKNTVYLQLGGILKGLDANSFLNTKDLIIPTLKLTLISKLTKIQEKKVKYISSTKEFKFN